MADPSTPPTPVLAVPTQLLPVQDSDMNMQIPPPNTPRSRTSRIMQVLSKEIWRVLKPPHSDLEIETVFPRGSQRELVTISLTLIATLAYLGFTLWYWFQSEMTPASFWLQIALLTNWGLLLCIVLGSLTSYICMQQHFTKRYSTAADPWWEKSFRISNNVHMWPTVFTLQAVILIGFYSTSSTSTILESGNIPAHLTFPFLCIHLFFYRIPVQPAGFLPPIVTGIIYCIVAGIYTLSNGGVGSYEPESQAMNFQNGTTPAVIFIALAVILVFFSILYLVTKWRDKTWPPAHPENPPVIQSPTDRITVVGVV